MRTRQVKSFHIVAGRTKVGEVWKYFAMEAIPGSGSLRTEGCRGWYLNAMVVERVSRHLFTRNALPCLQRLDRRTIRP